MRKYKYIIKLNLQTSLAYKGNFILTSLMDLFRVLAEIAFWTVLFANVSDGEINGYHLDSMITYYILVFMIGTFTNTGSIGIKAANDIKEGTLNQLLVKPIPYIGYCFAEVLSRKIVELVVVLVLFLPVLALWSSGLHIEISIGQLLLLPVVILLSLLLNFLVNMWISLLVFWLTEVTSFFFFKDILLDFVSGRVFPLDLLPRSVFYAFSTLPFFYMTFFPIAAVTKGLSDTDFYQGLGMQLVWVVLLFLLVRVTWKLGIKHYAGTGA